MPITNVVIEDGQVFATLDNADPSGIEGGDGCQDKAYRIPSGWSLADPHSTATMVNISFLGRVDICWEYSVFLLFRIGSST